MAVRFRLRLKGGVDYRLAGPSRCRWPSGSFLQAGAMKRTRPQMLQTVSRCLLSLMAVPTTTAADSKMLDTSSAIDSKPRLVTSTLTFSSALWPTRNLSSARCRSIARSGFDALAETV